jgi:hypothetical protein
MKRWQRMSLEVLGILASFVAFGMGTVIPIYWLGFGFLCAGAIGFLLSMAFFVNEL